MATITFLCSTALKSSFDELRPQFEHTRGHKVETTFGPSAQLTKRLTEGKTADAFVLTGPGFEEVTRLSMVASGSRAAIARSSTMVAVKQGTPWPDISTVETFKQAMLAAKSIAYSGPGAGVSGAHIAKVMAQLGIANAMKPKTVLGPGGPAGLIGNYLVRGQAEIGFQQDSELMAVPGVEIVGPLPGEFALVTDFIFGIHAHATDDAAAKSLGQLLRSSEARATMESKGLTPA